MSGGRRRLALAVSALLLDLTCLSCMHASKLAAKASDPTTPVELPEAQAPSTRAMTPAVWTGGAMIVWGGVGAPNDVLNKTEGAMYFAESKRWKGLKKVEATTRFHHSAVWTGKYLAVWGGVDSRSNNRLGSGWLYDPDSDEWRAMTAEHAPSPRSGHSAVWTGRYMVVWGGESDSGPLRDGALYDPTTDTWQAVANDAAPPARSFHTANWTGSQMIVWGGIGEGGNLSTGALFDPEANSWRPLPAADAPIGRVSHSAVWTGKQLIIWGGRQDHERFLNDGALYDPVANKWTPLQTSATSPSPRELHSSVWTDKEMVIWGGQNSEHNFAGGAAFDPETNSWRKLTDTARSFARSQHAAVWTGTEMLVFGGRTKQGALLSKKIGIAVSLTKPATATPGQ